MSNRLSVLLWKDASANPDNIPGEWPAEVSQLPDGVGAVFPRITMTQDEYDARLVAHQIEYNDWARARDFSTEKVRLGELVRTRAYELETAGVILNEQLIATDRASQSMIGNALAYLTLNTDQTIDWQAPSGAFVELNLAGIRALATAVGAHVQAHFTRRKELFAIIEAADDPEDLPGIEVAIRTFYAS